MIYIYMYILYVYLKYAWVYQYNMELWMNLYVYMCDIWYKHKRAKQKSCMFSHCEAYEQLP